MTRRARHGDVTVTDGDSKRESKRSKRESKSAEQAPLELVGDPDPRRSLAVAVIERWHAERVRLGLVRPGPAPGPTAERIAKINARGMDLERWSLVVRRAARDLEMQAERGRCSARATSGASFFTIETLARQRQRYLEAEHLDDRPAPDMGVDVAGILRGMT